MTNRWRHSLWLRIYPVKISSKDEPTWRCQQNPFIRALGIQEPVIPGEPSIEGLPVNNNYILSNNFLYGLPGEI